MGTATLLVTGGRGTKKSCDGCRKEHDQIREESRSYNIEVSERLKVANEPI